VRHQRSSRGSATGTARRASGTATRPVPMANSGARPPSASCARRRLSVPWFAGRVCGKLGVAGRAELAAALRRGSAG
jgi:hypothetical protein